jgi:hypothetical protein
MINEPSNTTPQILHLIKKLNYPFQSVQELTETIPNNYKDCHIQNKRFHQVVLIK